MHGALSTYRNYKIAMHQLLAPAVRKYKEYQDILPPPIYDACVPTVNPSYVKSANWHGRISHNVPRCKNLRLGSLRCFRVIDILSRSRDIAV